MQYGYDLATKHGKGFRRNIRYDDTAMSYCIDVLIPGKNNNKWSTVTYEQAFVDREEARKGSKLGESLSTQNKAGTGTTTEEEARGQATTHASAGVAAATAPTTEPGNFSTWGQR